MRLEILKSGHNPLQKILLSFIRLTMGGQAPAPILLMSYRRKFFGQHMADWFQKSMRSLQYWDVTESEIIAAYVSHKNQCQYCLGGHTAVVTKATKNEVLIQQVLENLSEAPVSENIKNILPFVGKLTNDPESVTKEDITFLIGKGFTKKAIEEAAHICAVFCVINRLADSFDFEMTRNPKKVAGFLYRFGYGKASAPG